MTKYKKGLCALLTLALLLGITVPAFAAAKSFTDVKPADWHYVPVMQAAELGLINGYEDGRFGPNETITRAQMMQILYNYYGEDNGTASGFSDVPETAWFAKAVTWAVNKGLITPASADAFAPNAPLGREAMVYSLYALEGSPDANQNALAPFTDKNTISSYAKDAFAWTISNQIVSGMSATELAPNGNATRAQVAVIMTRYLEKTDTPLPNIEVPDNGRNPDDSTNADAVNAIHNVGKNAAYCTFGTTEKANANGYYTEADVYIAESTLRYDLLDELNKYLTSEGLGTATWVTLDEAEEYTLMRAHEADMVWHMDGVKDLDHDKMADVMHARIDGSPVVAPENLRMDGRIEDAHNVMNGWINSDGHRGLLRTAPGYEVCFASSGDVCVMTLWTSELKTATIPIAKDNYFFDPTKV